MEQKIKNFNGDIAVIIDRFKVSSPGWYALIFSLLMLLQITVGFAPEGYWFSTPEDLKAFFMMIIGTFQGLLQSRTTSYLPKK